MSDNLSPLIGPSGPVGFSLNPEQDKIQPRFLKVFDEITVEKADQLRSGPNIYRMEAKVRGYCVIIDNVEFEDKERCKTRFGSTDDAHRLKEVFTQMGFVVKPYSNLTAVKMHKACSEISKDQNLSEHDALVVIILSHGGNNGLICGTDYSEIDGKKYGHVTDKRLLHVFNDKNCPLLKGKPKMFFFNCCRGNIPQMDSVNNDQSLSDVFVGYGTKDGYVGFRDEDDGSYFAIALATKLIQLSCDKELRDIFDEITNYAQELAAEHIGGKQNPTFDTYKWRKDLYFNTGLDQTNSGSTESIAIKLYEGKQPQEGQQQTEGSVVEGVGGTKHKLIGQEIEVTGDKITVAQGSQPQINQSSTVVGVGGSENYLEGGKIKVTGRTITFN